MARVSSLLLALLATFVAWALYPYTGVSDRARVYLKPGAWAVIAGGSDGLGEEWARQLAALGVNLVLIARRKALLEDVASSLRAAHPGVEVVTLQQDLSSLSADWVERQALADRNVRLLVYNAAYTGPQGDFVAGDVNATLGAIDVNVRGVSLFSQLMARHLRRVRQSAGAGPAVEPTGGIVLMSSMAGTVGSAWIANYAATKAYITALSWGLHEELRAQGTDVVGCVAGATVTPTYLGTVGRSNNTQRVQAIEQTSEEVVTECLASLGRTGAVATGPLNKLVEAVFARLLPRSLAVRIFSDQTFKQMGFGQSG